MTQGVKWRCGIAGLLVLAACGCSKPSPSAATAPTAGTGGPNTVPKRPVPGTPPTVPDNCVLAVKVEGTNGQLIGLGFCVRRAADSPALFVVRADDFDEVGGVEKLPKGATFGGADIFRPESKTPLGSLLAKPRQGVLVLGGPKETQNALTAATGEPRDGDRLYLATRTVGEGEPYLRVHPARCRGMRRGDLVFSPDNQKLELMGTSGAPVLNAFGEVVGMSYAQVSSPEGEKAGLAYPVSTLGLEQAGRP